VSSDTEAAQGELLDFGADLAFERAGSDETLGHDLGEQVLGFVLRLEQRLFDACQIHSSGEEVAANCASGADNVIGNQRTGHL